MKKEKGNMNTTKDDGRILQGNQIDKADRDERTNPLVKLMIDSKARASNGKAEVKVMKSGISKAKNKSQTAKLNKVIMLRSSLKGQTLIKSIFKPVGLDE